MGRNILRLFRQLSRISVLGQGSDEIILCHYVFKCWIKWIIRRIVLCFFSFAQ